MLYLVRHGQTEWNNIHKLQGETNVPLNENGRQMARDLKEEIKDVNFDICFSSPLDRAFETAKIILEGRDISIIKDDRIKELSFGDYEGSFGYYTEPDHPLYPLFHSPEKYVAENNVESIDELNARTKDFILKEVYPLIKEGKDVLVVAHGAMDLSIYNQLHDIPIERYWEKLMANCDMISVDDEKIIKFFKNQNQC